MVLLASAAPFGCSDAGNAGLSPSTGCNTSADCPANNECSANACVAFMACVDSSACAAGHSCVASVCRATCTSNVQCAPLQLSCDLAAGVCQPSPSMPNGAGGSAGSAGNGSAVAGESATGGGSVGTSSGGASMGGVAGSSAPALEISELIDDLEDGDDAILDSAGRAGQWYFYNPSGDNVAGAINQTFSTQFAGANGTKYSVETKGGPLSEDSTQSYAGLAFDFDNQGNAPTDPSRKAYDVSAWDGVSFWAKANSTSTESVRVEFPSLQIVKPEQQGTCVDGSACYDAYGKEILLTPDWAEYRVAFADLVQEGWGASKALDLHAVFGLAFEYLNTASSFDFAIDQVALYGKPSPTTGDGGASGSGGSSAGGSGGSGGSGAMCSGALGGYSDGSITFYTLDQVGSSGVNCSFDILARNPDKIAHTATGGGLDFVAINTADYNAAATCGACVEVARDDGRKVTVTVVDQCRLSSNSKCTAGHLELSQHAFDQVASSASESYVGTSHGGDGGNISWKYVACPTTETVQLRVKEPGNTSWNAVLVTGSRYAIKSVSIGGRNASRQDYNYWLPPGGVMGDGSVLVTDVNGTTIAGKVNIGTQGDQDTGKQFTCH